MESVNVSWRFRASLGMIWKLGVLLNSVVIPSPHTILHTKYYDNYLQMLNIKLFTKTCNDEWRFLAGARNDMVIRLLWGAEVAIRVIYSFSKQLTCESPLLPPCAPQGHCHPERQRGISFSYYSTIQNRPSNIILGLTLGHYSFGVLSLILLCFTP